MNNCGEDGVFIIGATNLPSSIDPAIMRAGRLDKKIYVPVPDLEARSSIFKMYLAKRPVELGLDLDILAKSTENFASVDIKNICDEASRQSLFIKKRVSMEVLLQTIKKTRPSSTIVELKKYRSIKAQMEGLAENSNERPGIGFKNN
jgi:transitional endoplasmic reticulum ATPase